MIYTKARRGVGVHFRDLYVRDEWNARGVRVIKICAWLQIWFMIWYFNIYRMYKMK